MSIISSTGSFQTNKTFAFNHNFLSTVSIKPVKIEKTPYKLDISYGDLNYSQQIYDQIAYDERAQDVKQQFEAMGFQAQIRRNGNLRYSGLINKKASTFNYNTTERGTSTSPISTSEFGSSTKPISRADKSIETFPSKLQSAISAGYVKEVRLLDANTPAKKINEMNEEISNSIKKKRQDNINLNVEIESPLKYKGGKILDSATSSEAEEEYAVSSSELVKLKQGAKFTKGMAKLDKETSVYERINKNMKKKKK